WAAGTAPPMLVSIARRFGDSSSCTTTTTSRPPRARSRIWPRGGCRPFRGTSARGSGRAGHGGGDRGGVGLRLRLVVGDGRGGAIGPHRRGGPSGGVHGGLPARVHQCGLRAGGDDARVAATTGGPPA